ncbi:uncharacterized protein PG986_002185 [Apiospora aurea]|uniref:Uncharacterized protein n=1 Tax=Apiospora aurea TaxID=335848 RepID=A0ABR1QZQ3_9PEZI
MDGREEQRQKIPAKPSPPFQISIISSSGIFKGCRHRRRGLEQGVDIRLACRLGRKELRCQYGNCRLGHVVQDRSSPPQEVTGLHHLIATLLKIGPQASYIRTLNYRVFVPTPLCIILPP